MQKYFESLIWFKGIDRTSLYYGIRKITIYI